MNEWEILSFVLIIGFYVCWWKYPDVLVFAIVLFVVISFLITGVSSIISGELFYVIFGLVCVVIGIQCFRAYIDDIKRMKMKKGVNSRQRIDSCFYELPGGQLVAHPALRF